MKIVHVHPRMSVMGGGERVAIHSIKEALREGHEVYFVSEKFDVEAFEDFFGVQDLFKNVHMLSYPIFRPPLTRAVLYQRLVYHQQWLRKLVSKKGEFDFVLNTAEVANHPRVRLPSAQYCYFPEYFSHEESNALSGFWRLYYGPARVFYRSRVSLIRRFLAVSDFTREFVREKWGRDSTTLYPPCPIDLYRDLQNHPKENLVITVGRIAPEKRMQLFLEIAHKLPEVKFAIVGSIPEDKKWYYENLKRITPGNVSFIIAPLRKVRDVLGKAKVYVHTTQNEHFGITIVEAMAAGCVPVVHNSGGPREIVSDGVGYRWNTIDEAIDRITSLTREDERRVALSKAAASRAERFRPEAFEWGLGKVLSIYDQ